MQLLGRLILPPLQAGQLLERDPRVCLLPESLPEGLDPRRVRHVSPLWYMRAPPVSERNRSRALFSSPHWWQVWHSISAFRRWVDSRSTAHCFHCLRLSLISRRRCPSVAYSSNLFTVPSKSPFPSYFSVWRLNFFSSTLLCSSPSLVRALSMGRGGRGRHPEVESGPQMLLPSSSPSPPAFP